MAKSLEALDYLARPANHPPRPVCVVYGDESLLKREVILSFRASVLGDDQGQFSLATFAGRETSMRDLADELATFAMFGAGRRLVIVEDADEFVTRNRAELEAYAAHPRDSAVLVLDVRSWPSNTRLFKMLAETGLQIECKFPSPARLLKWMERRAAKPHEAALDSAAAELLMESTEQDLGLIDQELAKLSALVGQGGTITAELVRDAVGTWRTRTAWDMLDAAASGRTAEALVQLDHLLLAGEVPIAILAQIGSTLRRFAAATRIVEETQAAGRRITLTTALEQAGFRSFAIGKAESQLRAIGRTRAGKLYGWLLEADLALKGTSSAPGRARLELERLLVRISARELQTSTL